jgi:hypothetical protein
MKPDSRLTIDLAADCAYFQFSQNPIATTSPLTDLLNVDLDSSGHLVGLELLAIEAEVPFDALVRDYQLSEKNRQDLEAALALL